MENARRIADSIIADAKARRLEKIDIGLVRSRIIAAGEQCDEATELYILRRVIGALV